MELYSPYLEQNNLPVKPSSGYAPPVVLIPVFGTPMPIFFPPSLPPFPTIHPPQRKRKFSEERSPNHRATPQKKEEKSKTCAGVDSSNTETVVIRMPKQLYDQPLQKRSKSQTGYYGVRFNTNGKRYRATVSHAGKGINVGTFNSPQVAAFAYDRRLIELKGRMTLISRLNFPDYWVDVIRTHTRKLRLDNKKRDGGLARTLGDVLDVDDKASFDLSVVLDHTCTDPNPKVIQVPITTNNRGFRDSAEPIAKRQKLGGSFRNGFRPPPLFHTAASKCMAISPRKNWSTVSLGS